MVVSFFAGVGVGAGVTAVLARIRGRGRSVQLAQIKDECDGLDRNVTAKDALIAELERELADAKRTQASAVGILEKQIEHERTVSALRLVRRRIQA